MSVSPIEFSTESLLSKIQYIQNDVDENFRLILNPEWKSGVDGHRLKIRQAMEKKFTVYFTREQLALLNDLNWLPEANEGFFSISHSKSFGGFSFSTFKHGFDVEDMRRISLSTLKRTASDAEFNRCPRAEFLWVAKEAGLKAHSPHRGYERTGHEFVVTDFITSKWTSHFENQVFSFRLNSEKTLDFGLNKGFIFLEGDKLFCIYFK